MPENQHPGPDNEHTGSAEFDASNDPDQVGCKALPSLDGQVVTVEVEDAWGERVSVEGVPQGAITRMNMPRLGPNIPQEVHDVIDQGHGVSMLRCRKEEIEGENIDSLESPTMVQIPTISGDVELMVRRKALVRKVN